MTPIPYNGSGTFQRVMNWAADRDAAIKITATRHDAEDDGFATGLSNAICKDGQTVVTANLPMAGFINTGVGNATATNHYAAYGQVQNSAALWGGTDTGAANAYIWTLTPVLTAYAAGQTYRGTIGAGNTNTGVAATVKFSAAGGTKAVVMPDGSNPPPGALTAARSYEFLYDGTAFILIGAAAPNQYLFKALAGTASGTNGTGVQEWFISGSSVAVAAATSYFFDGNLFIDTGAGVNARNFSLLFGGTATLTAIQYIAFAPNGSGVFGTQRGDNIMSINVATATQVIANAGQAGEYVSVRGIVRINAGGTLTPQFQYSANPGAAPVVQIDSYFRLQSFGTNTAVTQGTWT